MVITVNLKEYYYCTVHNSWNTNSQHFQHVCLGYITFNWFIIK